MIGSYNYLNDDLSRKCHLRSDPIKRKHFPAASSPIIPFYKTRKETKIQSDAFITEQKSNPPDLVMGEKVKRETYRLASFRKCKIAVPPYDLAMAGFYYIGPGDKVRCFSCGNCVQSWKPKDDVSSERWHMANCRHFFKKNSENISIGDTGISIKTASPSASPGVSFEPIKKGLDVGGPSFVENPTAAAGPASDIKLTDIGGLVPGMKAPDVSGPTIVVKPSVVKPSVVAGPASGLKPLEFGGPDRGMKPTDNGGPIPGKKAHDVSGPTIVVKPSGPDSGLKPSEFSGPDRGMKSTDNGGPIPGMKAPDVSGPTIVVKPSVVKPSVVAGPASGLKPLEFGGPNRGMKPTNDGGPIPGKKAHDISGPTTVVKPSGPDSGLKPSEFGGPDRGMKSPDIAGPAPALKPSDLNGTTSVTKPRIKKTVPFTKTPDVAATVPNVNPPDYKSIAHHKVPSVEIKSTPSASSSPVLGFGTVYQQSHHNLLGSLRLNREEDRRKTFTSQWPRWLLHLIEPLAKTGFFYLGNADRTQCFSCGAVQRNWQEHDDVHRIHAEIFAECGMINNTEKRNVSIEEQFDVRAPQVFLPVSSPVDEPGFDIYSAPSQPHGSNLAHANIQSIPEHSQGHNDLSIQGPPVYRGPDDHQSGRLGRQISQQSNETAYSSLEGITSNYSAENFNFPPNRPGYTPTLPLQPVNRHRVSPSSPSSVRSGDRASSHHSAFAPVLPGNTNRVILPSSSSGEFTYPKSPTSSSTLLGPSAAGPRSTNGGSPAPVLSVPRTSPRSRYEESNITIPSSSRTAVRGASIGSRAVSSPHSSSPLGLSRISPGMLSSSSNLYIAPPTSRYNSIASYPESRIARGSRISPISAAISVAAPGSLNITLPQSSSATTSVVASSNAVVTTSASGSISLLLPTSSNSPTSIRRVHSQPAPRISQPSSATELLIRELDPLTAVSGFEPATEAPAPLPESELDVDDDYVNGEIKASLRDLYPCREPVRRDMVYLSQRISTFCVPWPEDNSLNSIPDVAKAGFYYLGVSDHVRCWYCGIEAKTWVRNRSAWEIHALLYPSCQYLLRNRGSGFVETVLSQEAFESRTPTPESEPSSYPSSLGEYPGYSGQVVSGPERLPTPPIIDPRQEEEDKKIEFRRAMQSEMVDYAIAMGFTRNHVRQVVKKQIDEFSCSFQTSDALVSALIMSQEDLIDLNDEGDNNRDRPSTSSREGLIEDVDDDVDLYRSQESFRAAQPAESSGVAVNPPPPAQSSGEGTSQGSSKERDLEAELLRLQHQKRCKVCLDRDANMLFVPCGHMCACMQCASRLKQCPLCRSRIDKAYKTYANQ